MAQQITRENILRVLVIGFALVTVLLLAAGFIGIKNLQAIKENAASLVEEQLVTTRLIDEIQREQGTLSAVFYHLVQAPESVDRAAILAQLNEADTHIDQIVSSIRGTQEPLWEDLQSAATTFSQEARRLLASENQAIISSRDLLRRHQQVLSIVSRLIAASHEKADIARNQINSRSEELIRQSFFLLGACLVLALFCAVLTVRTTTELFRKMEWQAGELSRVSWHMLENQENTARRFSHELHDELGQSLTAIKANLVAIQSRQPLENARVQDCLALVDEAIGNIRELSQLLHPTILDDFGLDEGLRWLAEGFTQRTGIVVDFSSNFKGRLPDETETHLFRICQEALTNVARHSGASRVIIQFRTEGNNVRLSIGDNGRGLDDRRNTEQEGMGMIGMRARARSAGGELELRSAGETGVLLEVRVPVESERHAEKDQYSVSR